MTEHTPTPWVARRSQLNDLWSIYVGTNDDKSLAAVHDPYANDDAVAEANAAFIVRAANNFDPMLTAIRLALKRLTELNRDDEAGMRLVLSNVLSAADPAVKDAE